MTFWTDSKRRTHRDPDWDRIRTAVRRRAGGKCEWLRVAVLTSRPDPAPCPAYGVDVARILPDSGDHAGNLAWLCTAHRREHATP